MGSAAIPLQVQTPKIASPLQTIGGIMQLRGQMADIALRNQQVEQAKQQSQLLQAEQQQKNRDLSDVNAYTALIKDADVQAKFNGDGDITPFQRAGIQPKYIDALVKARQDKLAGALTLDKDTLANRATATGQLTETAKNLFAPNADGTPADLDTINSRYQSARGALAPLMKMGGFDAPLPGSISSVEQLQQVHAALQGQHALYTTALADQKTQGEIANTAAQTAATNATANKTNTMLPLEAAGAKTKNEQDARVLAGTSATGITADEAAKEAETARHNKSGEAVNRAELGLKQKQFDATFGSGLDVNGQPLSPEAMKAVALQDPSAVAIANYQIAPPSVQTRGGLPSPIMRKVLAIDKNYDATTFPARSKTAADFSPAGKSGQTITAADTALAHLNTLSDAGAALKNNDIQKLNQLANYLGAQTGGTARETYNTILNMVGPEISKSVIGAVGGERERAGTAANFSSDLSDSQRESNIGAAVSLLGARFDKAAHAYESEMGRPLARTLSPESQAIRKRYTSGGQSVSVGQTVKLKGGKMATISAVHPDGSFDVE